MRFQIAALVLVVFMIAAGAPTGAQPAPTARLDVTEEWSIHAPPSSHKALLRAARDLRDFLRDRHGLELEIVEEEMDGPGISLAVDERRKDDRFSLRADASRNRVVVEGSSPRAVYQGVLVLEDRLTERPALSRSLDETVVFPFEDRYLIWNTMLTGQNKEAIGFDLERHVREAVRLGYTGMECNRFVGMTLVQQGHPRDPYPWYTYWGPSMDQFVTSPLFEGVFAKEYLSRNLADLKHVAAVVESFGLKPIFTGYEPRYVPEEFLKRRPDLRGPRVDHPLRSMTPRYSLCTDRQEVREHYRTLAKRLAEEVPDIREMHIIIHDSGAGLCWYNGLYSGRNGPAHCKNTPMGERMRKMYTSIRNGLLDGGLDIPVVVQPHGGNKTDFDAFFDSVPAEVEFTAGNWASWHPLYRDPLGIDRHILSRQRETGRRTIYYQQHFVGFNVAPTSEFPLVYSLAERLKRAQGLNLDVLNTLGGIVSPPIKERSAMQEIYRRFLFQPDLTSDALVERVARDLGGAEGGALLVAGWKYIHLAFERNRKRMGFGAGIEYASRRTLIRPLAPDTPALLPEERDWWQAYTFAGDLRFGHAHLFRGEGGLPSQESYMTNRDRSARSRDAFQQAGAGLRAFLSEHPDAVRAYPYLFAHERQLRFLAHVYGTGANLYEGQRILDRYSKTGMSSKRTRREADADLARFKAVAANEIENTQAFIEFLEEGGDIGMVLLPQETTWGYGKNLPALLRKKIEVMKRHLPETEEVFHRWFESEY